MARWEGPMWEREAKTRLEGVHEVHEMEGFEGFEGFEGVRET